MIVTRIYPAWPFGGMPWVVALLCQDNELAGEAPALQFCNGFEIAENLDRVREQIAQAAAKAGRAADDIELVAITKTHPAEKVREAVEVGQTLFGESRVQEARVKIPELPSVCAGISSGICRKTKFGMRFRFLNFFTASIRWR